MIVDKERPAPESFVKEGLFTPLKFQERFCDGKTLEIIVSLLFVTENVLKPNWLAQWSDGKA